MEQIQQPVNMQTVRMMLKNNFKVEWMRRWIQGSTGRTLYNEMSKPNPNDNINKLRRAEQCTIFQLRTGHTKLKAHLNRFNPEREPNCRNCQHPYETTDHVLFTCPALTSDRRKLLPAIPTIRNTLYGSTYQLQNTHTFFNLALAAKE